MTTPPNLLPAYEALAKEVRGMFQVLVDVSNFLHDDKDGLTLAHRGVMETLFKDGEMPVPELARLHKVTRQHVQVLVNRLIELELVETCENVFHKRSVLLGLTRAGRKRFETMQSFERRALACIPFGVSAERMREAAETLRKLQAMVPGIKGD